ncbi:surface-adhesin E family protein [Novosphingobium kaempferiae]|uniref:surface-adhesin E family protein n=1 Tax=Novosphingobium kaempferiae TaxID=2896849 RepID=UPI001E2D04F2|nr:surface-adhesin E family protein [Novosphingobium kaempferiae]
MKSAVLGIAFGLSALLPSSAQARSSEWWYVAQAADKVLFIDVGSIRRDGDTVRYEASQILRESGNPAASLRAWMITDCRKRTESWDLYLRYGPQDERLDETALSSPDPEPVVPGTLGDAQMQFVCASDHSATDGFPLKIDEVAFAEALITDTAASEPPAAMHERMRADPRVPVIRSTAPAPDTFGTPQHTMAGDAVVPPRDYAKGTALPDPKNYDTDESGTIYDIAYIGIEDGQMTFEQRGYSINDLAHAGSAQTMRFPASQKSVRIADIMIDVIEADAQNLSFRARLSPEPESGPENNDAPFPCLDPACTPR